ncbi:ATP-binding mismatch repair protein [Apophysomyces sp. BC1034]|nr:ATP-binding mismatch repair protein [Apophysomyces sp. BC1021]KAG0189416.1 ATP-binding mismatch repair protein [Apophysomyces sp. BC1034]
MSTHPIHALDQITVRHLHSGQVIVDVESIVKELVENALDAGSSVIQVKLINNGLMSIQIKDNGSGIEESCRPVMARRYHTSKIISFEDIDRVTSLGFRGEALSSICAVAEKFQITTKTANDTVARQYDFDRNGSIVCEKVVTTLATAGTIITVHEPFRNTPVRRQIAQKNATMAVKRIQDLLINFSLSHPSTRLSLQQAQDTLGSRRENTWIKPAKDSVLESISAVYGAQLADLLTYGSETETDGQLTVEYVLPKPGSGRQSGFKTSFNIIKPDLATVYKGDRVFVFVNNRAINYTKSELKEMVAMVRKRCKEAFALEDSSKKTPFMYIHIKVKPDQYDVNIEPNKNAVLFHRKQSILNMVEMVLDRIYGSNSERFFNPRRNTESSRVIEVETPVSLRSVDTLTEATTLKDIPESSRRAVRVDDNEAIHEERSQTANAWSFSMSNEELIESDEEDEVGHMFSNKDVAAVHKVPLLGNWLASKQAPIVRETEDQVITADKQVDDIMEWQIGQPEKDEECAITPANNNSAQGDDLICQERAKRARSLVLPTVTHKTPSITIDDQPQAGQSRGNIELVQQQITRRRDKDINKEPPVLKSSFAAHSNSPPYAEKRRTAPLTASITRARRRNISEILLNQHGQRKIGNETLGEEMTLECDMASIRQDCAIRQTRQSQFYRCRLEDWPLCMDAGEDSVDLLPHTLGHDLTLYSRRKSSDELGLFVNEIEQEVFLLLQGFCPNRPIQMVLSESDPLFTVLLSLKGREQQVADDQHGCIGYSYTVITDRYVIANGFGVRWRKCSHSPTAIIQLTAVFDMGTVYGLSDFRELLQLIKNHAPDVPLSQVRPAKVVDYFYSLAEHNAPGDYDASMVETVLDAVNWTDVPCGNGQRVGLTIDQQVLSYLLWSSQKR